MGTACSRSTIMVAALLPAPDLSLVTDAPPGEPGQADLLGSPSLAGVTGADAASSLSVGRSAYEVSGWLVAADGYPCFTADDAVSGCQLWQTPVSEA